MVSGALLEKHCFSWFCKDMRRDSGTILPPHSTQFPAAHVRAKETDQCPICQVMTGSSTSGFRRAFWHGMCLRVQCEMPPVSVSV